MCADSKIAKRTGFQEGSSLYYIQRLRFLDQKPLILDHNYFFKEMTPGLTPEIAAHSIYEYLEQTLHLNISTSQTFDDNGSAKKIVLLFLLHATGS